MNTRTNKIVLLITLMICLATAVYSAVGTFTFRTSGASDTTEVVDLRYPQKVPEDASVTNDKLAEPVSVANGGTGKTTAAAALTALGGASLVGSSTVDFSARVLSVTTGVSVGTTYPWITGGVASATFGDNGVLTVQKYNGDALVANDYDQFDLYIGNRTNSQNGKFWVDGVGTTTEIHDPGTIFSNTKDNPGTINVYVESFAIRIQNKTGATKSVKVFVEGFDE